MKLLTLIFNFPSFLCSLQLLEVQYLQRKIRLAEFKDCYSLSVLASYLNDTWVQGWQSGPETAGLAQAIELERFQLPDKTNTILVLK